MTRGPIRRAAVAGSWYPGEPRRLAEILDAYLARAETPSVEGRLVGLVSPHAGLVYSGPVAAHGYSLLGRRQPSTVVLVGPSHHMAFAGVSVVACGAFETPLGELEVSEPVARRLIEASPHIQDDPRPHRPEHSLEMQLPFLAHLSPQSRIVPLLMGDQSRASVDALAEALGRALEGEDVVLVASSDLSHFNPAPVANEMDARVVADVARFEPEALMDRLEACPDHACGGGPVVAVMKACRHLGADRAAVLRYADSGDEGPRDKAQVVGYVSAALTRGS
jgi:AmmeMemoRadiSam system protein B